MTRRRPGRKTARYLHSHFGFVAVLMLLLASVPTGRVTALAGSADPGTTTISTRFEESPATPVAAEATPIALETVGLMDPDERPVDPRITAIDKLLNGEDGVFGIILMEPDGTLIYNRNAETPFVSASLYKLILMADICKAVEEGLIFLDTPLYVDWNYFQEADGTDSYFDINYAGYETTVEEALFATGAYSSNVAAHALLTLTSPEELNAMAQSLGLTGTFLFQDPLSTPDWPPTPTADSTKKDVKLAVKTIKSYSGDGQVNITTPRDMALYFQKLLKGKIVNKSVSRMIIDILEQQQITNRIPALLPPDTKTVHKTGNLDHVIHDAGIVYAPDGPIILIAMAQGQKDDVRATAIEQRLGLIAYGELDIPPIPQGSPIPGDGTGLYESALTPVPEEQ